MVTVPIIRTAQDGRSTVHLVGPDVSPLHRFAAAAIAASTSPLSIRIRGVEGLARAPSGRPSNRGSVGVDFHVTLSAQPPDRVLLTLGDDTDEITDLDDGDQPRNIADRGLVDRDQAGADKGTGIRRQRRAGVPTRPWSMPGTRTS